MAMIYVDDVFMSESGDFADFVVRLDGPSAQAISVQYVTFDREASRFSDYTTTTGTLGFAVGETTKTIRVPVTRDTALEATESFGLSLTNPTNAAIARAQATVFIRDNDSPAGVPNISVTDATVDERDGQLVFAVTLDRPASAPVTVNFDTEDATAQTGFDFTDTQGTLTFAPGQTLLTVAVPINDDAEPETTESFSLRLSAPGGGVLGRSQGTGFIAASDQVSQSNPLATVRAGAAGESDGFLEFVIELAAPTDKIATVTATTADISASRFSDYLTTQFAVSFNPGETARVIRVPLTGDSTLERTEILGMGLSGAVNLVAGGDGYGTIFDNDANTGNAVISLHDQVIDEGDAFARVLISLDRPSATPITVRVATGSGTALSEVDYAGIERDIIFAPGQMVQTFTVPVFNDDDAEQDEQFVVTLSNPSAGSLGRSSGSVLIGRSDLPNSPSPIVSTRTVTVGEADPSAPLVVQLSAPAAVRTFVDVQTSDQSGSRFSDYLTLSDRIFFEPGQTTRVVPVSVTEDTTVETAELVLLSMSAPSGLALGSVGNLIIRDNDANGTVGIAIGDAIVNEGEGFAVLPVWLTAPAANLLTVDFGVAGASAVSGADFAPVSGTLRFVPGQTVQNIIVPILNDVIPEPDEFFNVQLSNPAGAALADANGVVRIGRNDMTAVARPTASVEPFFAGEGDGYVDIVVQVDRPSTARATVTLTSADTTASRFSDYVTVQSALTFDAGDTTRVVRLPLTEDITSEGTETLRAALSAGVNLTVSTTLGSAVGTLVDNDNGATASQFVFGPAQADRRETNGNVFFLFEIERLGDVSQPAFVNFVTASSAANGADFGVAAMPNGQVQFAAGETARVVGLSVAGDSVLERNEDFTITLTPGFGGTVGQGPQTARIQNDDIAARNGAPQLGKDGSFLFDAAYYLSTYPELVATVGIDAAAGHYLNTGAGQGRSPNSWFDATYYKNRWPDLTPLNLDNATLFQHFNLFGVWEGRSPGPKFQAFDGNRYLTDNPDVAAYVDAFVADFLGSRTNGAIAHYIIYGANEQRVAFDAAGAAITLDYLFGY